MVGCRMRFFDVVQAIALDFASWRRACRLIPSQTASARSSMDRASDYGSEGWGFESLRARSGPPRCDPPVGALHFYLALLRECFFMPIRLCGPGKSVSCSIRDEGRPAVGVRDWWRDRTRPARFLPSRPATKFAQHTIRRRFGSLCAGRTCSRAGHSDVARLKPMTPLRPLMQASVKPPSPLLAHEQQALKPTTPLQPKNAPKTPISHPQRR